MYKKLLVIIISLVITSCNNYQSPRNEDIIGTWKPNNGRSTRIKKSPTSGMLKMSFKFNNNGTFNAYNIPNDFFEPLSPAQELHGRWKLSEDIYNEQSYLALSFDNLATNCIVSGRNKKYFLECHPSNTTNFPYAVIFEKVTTMP